MNRFLGFAVIITALFCGTVSAQIYRIAEMNTEQIRALDKQKTVVILTGGILEQHGPHLPSYSDVYVNEWHSERLAEAITERPGWAALMFATIPLGYSELLPNRADGYTWRNGGFHNAMRVSPTISFSLAGLVSTVLDLAKYDAALYTEKLLKKQTLDQMFTKAKLNNGQEIEHGLGFGMTPFRNHRRVGHSGGHTGFSTTITRLIDHKLTVIVLSNADSAGYLKRESFLMSEIANEIASYYFSK